MGNLGIMIFFFLLQFWFWGLIVCFQTEKKTWCIQLEVITLCLRKCHLLQIIHRFNLANLHFVKEGQLEALHSFAEIPT